MVNKYIIFDDKNKRNELIIKLYNEGNGTSKISNIVGITKRNVSKILKKNNINIRNIQPKTIFDIDKFIKLYNSGLTFTKIAERFNTTRSTVSRLIKNKINFIPTQIRLEILDNTEKELIKNEYLNKKSIYEISEIIKKHPEIIRRYLKRQNLIRSFEERKKLASIKLSNKLFKSSLHKYVEKILNYLNIKYENEFNIDGWLFDIYIPELKILIEIQGEYWHKLKNRIQRDIKKRKIAKSNGYIIKYFMESYKDRKEFSLNLLKYWTKTSKIINFNFKDIKIKLDNNGYDLINEFHYCGNYNKKGICLCGFVGQELIASALFSSPTKQNINKILELTRFIINPKYQVKNLASYFLSKCIKYVFNSFKDIKKLISFTDQTYGYDGTIYKATNWIFDGYTKPDYWYQTNSRNIIHKKVIRSRAKNSGLKESEYVKINNLIKVFDLPKIKWVYNNMSNLNCE